jgi:hypothetical protein
MWPNLHYFNAVFIVERKPIFSSFKQRLVTLLFQSKVLKYKEQCQVMENRLFEVNNLANQSQIRLNDTNEVLKSLEERLRTTEVSFS